MLEFQGVGVGLRTWGVTVSAAIGQEGKELYEFGPFRIDAEKELLFREGEPVPLTHRTFQILLVLTRHSQKLVSKNDLMQAVWPDTVVEEANLSRNIFMLRKALGENPEDHRYIVTVSGRGYRLAENVRVVPGQELGIAATSHSTVQMQVEELRRWGWIAATALASLLAVAAAGFWLFSPRMPVLNDQDTVVLADFANFTGDPVFDETLRQGMAVQLAQSPFLRLISDEQIQQTLSLMGQPPNALVTPAVARQVCERTASSAVLEGSIAALGNRYVLGLRAINCRTGSVLDEEQAQIERKEDVLNALDQMATKFRGRLGESLAAIKQHDTPLAEATTPSLAALKAYSTGLKLLTTNGDAAALPLFQRAIGLDPKFAMAYAWIGRIYGNLGEAALSAQNTTKAYDLRSRTSDAERFWITASYDTQVAENLEQAQQICAVWAQTYPHTALPHALLSGVIDPVLGEYQQAVAESQQAIQLEPDFAIAYYLLSVRYQNLDRLQDAETALNLAAKRKLLLPDFLLERYDLAFLQGDSTTMQRLETQGRDQPDADEWISDHQASVLAYSGRLQEARRMSQYASNLARQSGHREAAALYQVGAALWEVFSGEIPPARQDAIAALALSNDRGVEYGAALTLALVGDSARAQTLADDLGERFPEDTSVNFSYLPTLRARLALNRGEPAAAIESLEIAAPYELGTPRTALHANFGALYPIYERGEAYLAEHQGAKAATEFQKVLNHRGIVGSDPIGALAHLQLARAYMLSGNLAQAKSAYQDFLALWKNADPDIPVLSQARAEYAKLNSSTSGA